MRKICLVTEWFSQETEPLRSWLAFLVSRLLPVLLARQSSGWCDSTNGLCAGDFPNCRKLSEELNVSSKTIQRDIDFMRDHLGLPIEYDELRFGFFYSRPITQFPSVEIGEGELIALFVARKALEQYRGTPFEDALKKAFERLSEGLKDRIFTWTAVDAAVSFRGIGATVTELEVFEGVSKAVFDSLEIEFEYQKLGANKYERRRVQPYHVGCVENMWYLFALDVARGQIRTFALPRMRSVKETGDRFKRPADFSVNEHLGDSFGVFKGTGRYKVRIQFTSFAARIVSERVWHGSQKLSWTANGDLELTMTLDSLEEVERWVLSWGRYATVIEPPALVASLLDVASSLVARYESRAR
jgi:proteasome accessory factor B